MIQTLPFPTSSPTSRKGDAAEAPCGDNPFAALLATGNGDAPVAPQTPTTASAILGLTVGLNAAAGLNATAKDAAAKDAAPITVTGQALAPVAVAAPAPAAEAAPVIVPGQAADAIPATPFSPPAGPVPAAPILKGQPAPATKPQTPQLTTVTDGAALDALKNGPALDVATGGPADAGGASDETPAPLSAADPADSVRKPVAAPAAAWTLGASALWLQAMPAQPAASPVASAPAVVRAAIEPTAARAVSVPRPTPIVRAPAPVLLGEQPTQAPPERPSAPPAAGAAKTAAETLLEAVPARPAAAKEALPLAPDTFAPPADGPALPDLPPLDLTADHPADVAPTAETADAAPARRAVPVADLPLEVVRAARDGVERLEVRLHPEDLGTVEVTVETGRDTKTHVTIAAERPETLHLLNRDARMIERLLAAQGLDLSGGIQMELRQQGDGNARGRHGSNGSFSHKNGDAGTTEAADAPARLVSDRLYDLHV